MLKAANTLCTLLFVLTCALGGLACEDKVDPIGETGGGLPDQVTYNQHIKPLLDSHCVQCHATFRQGADRQGAPLGVDYDTYVAARASATRGNAAIQAGTMPPGDRLLQYDRSLFAKWVAQGTPE